MQEMLPILVSLKYIWHSICNSICSTVHVDSIIVYINHSGNPSFSPWLSLATFHPLIQGSQASSELRQFFRCRCTWGRWMWELCGAVDVSKLFEPVVAPQVLPPPLCLWHYSLDIYSMSKNQNPSQFVHYSYKNYC